MRRTNFLQIAVFLALFQVLACQDDPTAQGTSRERPNGSRFESNASELCSNFGDPADLISAFAISRSDSTSLLFMVTNHSSGATSYLLDFGDGSPFRAESFATKIHTFAGPGTFDIRLVVMRGDTMKCSQQRLIIDPFLSGGWRIGG